MGLVRTLIDRDQEYTGPSLPQGLRELYDGDLQFRTPPVQRPFVVGNFVSTLDGVVSYKIKGHAGGSTISGSDPWTASSWACCVPLLMPSLSVLVRSMT